MSGAPPPRAPVRARGAGPPDDHSRSRDEAPPHDEEFFNVLDWKIQSPDGVQQLATYALDKGLSAGQLAPGGTVSGDVCRQGPGAKGEYVVILDRTFLDPIRWKATI